jgi:hypothetical protein
VRLGARKRFALESEGIGDPRLPSPKAAEKVSGNAMLFDESAGIFGEARAQTLILL